MSKLLPIFLMGFFLSKLYRGIFYKGYDDNIKVVVIGMQNSGKTTILYKLALGEIVIT